MASFKISDNRRPCWGGDPRRGKEGTESRDILQVEYKKAEV